MNDRGQGTSRIGTRAWRSAERVLRLRVVASLAWLMVSAAMCLVDERPGRLENLDAAAAYLALASAVHGFSRWSRTLHGATLATLMLLDLPVLTVIQAIGLPFALGSAGLIAVSVWGFAFILIAGAMTLDVRNVSILALEGTLLQGALLAYAHRPDEFIGVTMAAFCMLAAMSVPITIELARASGAAHDD